jgi:hypothetical protein
MCFVKKGPRFLTLKDRRPSTVKDYKMLWRLHVPEKLKRKSLSEITSADVEKLKQRSAEKHNARQTRSSY